MAFEITILTAPNTRPGFVTAATHRHQNLAVLALTHRRSSPGPSILYCRQRLHLLTMAWRITRW